MNTPHGGILVQQIFDQGKKEKIIKNAANYKKIVLSDEEIKEVKNIARGLYSPLTGFLDKQDLDTVLTSLRLHNGIIFSIPIVITVSKEQAREIKLDKNVMLTDEKRGIVALMTVSDKYEYDKSKYAKYVFKTTDPNHPGVKSLLSEKKVFLGGKIMLLNNSKKPLNRYNLDPKETRFLFAYKGWKTIAGFQTRNPIHRGHEYLQRCVLEMVDGLFVNPVIGFKKKGDFKDELIIKSYEILVKDYFPRNKMVLSILPYKMRYAGPREAVFHAIIRKNFGCTHFIVGRDHAGVGKYYKPYEAQQIFDEIGDIGITIIKLKDAFYCKKCKCMATNNTCSHRISNKILLSGTFIRSLISEKKPFPEEIIRPQVSKLILNHKDPIL